MIANTPLRGRAKKARRQASPADRPLSPWSSFLDRSDEEDSDNDLGRPCHSCGAPRRKAARKDAVVAADKYARKAARMDAVVAAEKRTQTTAMRRAPKYTEQDRKEQLECYLLPIDAQRPKEIEAVQDARHSKLRTHRQTTQPRQQSFSPPRSTTREKRSRPIVIASEKNRSTRTAFRTPSPPQRSRSRSPVCPDAPLRGNVDWNNHWAPESPWTPAGVPIRDLVERALKKAQTSGRRRRNAPQLPAMEDLPLSSPAQRFWAYALGSIEAATIKACTPARPGAAVPSPCADQILQTLACPKRRRLANGQALPLSREESILAEYCRVPGAPAAPVLENGPRGVSATPTRVWATTAERGTTMKPRSKKAAPQTDSEIEIESDEELSQRMTRCIPRGLRAKEAPSVQKSLTQVPNSPARSAKRVAASPAPVPPMCVPMTPTRSVKRGAETYAPTPPTCVPMTTPRSVKRGAATYAPTPPTCVPMTPPRSTKHVAATYAPTPPTCVPMTPTRSVKRGAATYAPTPPTCVPQTPARSAKRACLAH